MRADTVIHVALTAVMAWLSVVLLLPGDTFATAMAFAVMAGIADERHWALAFWLVASVGLIGLVTRSRVLGLVAVLTVASMHGVVALCFVLANPVSTGTGTYLIIAGLGYYLAWTRTHDGV